jgi:hypothetical protein
VGGTIVYNIFGANPSATPTGLRGHSGMNYLIIGNSTLPGADLPYTLRGEARWTGTSWNLRSFVNGTFDNEVNDSRLLQGLPGFCVFVNPEPIITTYDPSRLVEITRFKGGLLR